MRKKLRICAVSLLFLLAGITQLPAQYAVKRTPDSSSIRRSLLETWFSVPGEYLRTKESEVYQNEQGDVFQIRYEDYGEEYGIAAAVLKPILVDVHTDRGVTSVTADSFPAEETGSWILFRSKKDDSPLRVRYFFHSDTNVFLQFRPGSPKIFADFIIYGGYAAQNVPMAVSFDDLISMSFAEIVSRTSGILPWQYTEIYNGMYDEILQTADVIRDNLDRFVVIEDACLDENGEPAYIANPARVPVVETGKVPVSPAGFIKWVADGIVYPQTGSWLRIEPLKTATEPVPPGSKVESISSKYNIYFGLDWVRNTAAAVMSVNAGKTVLFKNSGADVKISPFTAVDKNGAKVSVPAPSYNSGCMPVVLKPLMFVLAASEPGWLYLAAVRETMSGRNEISFYNQMAVILPYFDKDGRFGVYVFESGRESTIEAFTSRYADSYIHLVRVKASAKFFPQ